MISEAGSCRFVFHQDGYSPLNHGRFFIFGIFAPIGVYSNQGGNYQVGQDHNHQVMFPIFSFAYSFQGVFNV